MVFRWALVSLLALAGAPVRGAPPAARPGRVQVLETPKAPAGAVVDWGEVRDRTARFWERYARESAAAVPVLFQADKIAAFERLRAHVNDAGGRGATASSSRPAGPTVTADELVSFAKAVDADLANVRLWLSAVEASPDRPRAPAAVQLASHRELVEARAAEARALAVDAADAFRLQAGGLWSKLRLLGRRVVGRDGPTLVQKLDAKLRSWGAVSDASVLGAELTYIEGGQGAGRLPTSAVLPGYLSGSGTGLEDGAAGSEVELTDEIRSKASDLGSARAAYAFVKNEFRLDWYYGSLKASPETLRERRGNDVDLATLLIALLRAQGTSARYVQGTIELPVARVAELMGLLSGPEVDALHSSQGLTLDTTRRELVTKALAAAGVPYEPVVSGGRVESVKLLHTWVEAYLDYKSYRGAGARSAGGGWVPIDPAITGGPKSAAAPAAFDLLQGMGTDPAQLVSDYLASGASGQSPLAYLRTRAQRWLDGGGAAGQSYASARRSVAQRLEALPFIPGSLPYAVPAVHAEYAFLPDSAKHQLRIRVQNAGGTNLFDVTAPMHAVVGKRTVLAFEPATSDDALAISLAGGTYKVAAASVSVKPVLRVAGVPVGQATGALGLGEGARWTIDLLMPNGTSRTITNDVVAGNLVAIGLGGPVNGYLDAVDGAAGADGAAARVLYRAAVDYANSWTAGEEELAELLGVVPLRPTANLVLVENQLTVDQAFGVRRRLVWKGLEVDADHRSMTPLELVPGRGAELLRLSGFEGSFQEARVLRATTGEESVSAVTVIQEANRQGVPVLTITPANASAQLQQLSTTPAVYREIQDQLAHGREVIVPSIDLTIRDWTGTGFISRDPKTNEGGYFLTGIVSGGQTIVSPGSWLDQKLVEMLQAPTDREPETDTSLAGRIMKASAPIQRGLVGTKHDVAVYVTTIRGAPVYRAPVTFSVRAPSKGGLGSKSQLGGETSVRVLTDKTGLAVATFTSDTLISDNAIVEPGAPNEVLVGFNEVMATVDNGTNNVALETPFVVLGDHEAPAEIRLPDQITDASYPAGLQIPQDLWAFVLDKYGNPVPNTVLTWTSKFLGASAPLATAGVYLDLPNLPDRTPRVLDALDPVQYSSAAQYTSTQGGAEAGFIPYPVDVTRGAELRATVGSLSGAYRVIVYNPQEESQKYVLSLKRQHVWSFDGVFGADFQEPVGLQVLRWTGNIGRLWVPLAGGESDISRVVVKMEVADASRTHPVIIGHEEIEPRQRTIWMGNWVAFDDDSTGTFWPRSQVDGGQQMNIFGFEVDRPGKPPIIGRRQFGIPSNSQRPTIDRFRLLPGFEQKPTDEFGSVSAEDLAAVFRVNNPAGYPIYAAIDARAVIPGEVIVSLPPPDQAPRKADDPSLIEIPPQTRMTIRLGTVAGGHGGAVRLQISVPNPQLGPSEVTPLVYGESTIHIAPPGATLLSNDSKLIARVIMPVRNFAGTATPSGGKAYPNGADLPRLESAGLAFRVKGEGRVIVSSGQNVVAAADVVADQDGNLQANPAPVTGMPPLSVSNTGSLLAMIPPASPDVRDATVTFTSVTDPKPQTWTVPFTTVYKDMGPVPIGHTFVRDVDVVDGHLVKQAVDVSVQGRGTGLSFQRSYTNRSADDTPLGVGWTHNYYSYVVRDRSAGRDRYIVVGGEGTGQTFDCTAHTSNASPCTNQRGFHGRLDPAESRIVYTAPNGVQYTYGRLETGVSGVRWWLTTIADPRGNTTTLVYGGGDVGGELVRVYEPGNRRVLSLSYEFPAGAPRPRVLSVELMTSSTRKAELADELVAIDDSGLCVAYDHDAVGNLTAARRFDGACNPEAAPLRQELYQYKDSPLEVLRDDLVAYTDPNGHTTRYTYWGATEPIPGEGQFLLMGDKTERVKTIVEPSPGGTTAFTYGLVPKAVISGTTTRLLYTTSVAGPRSGVPPTTYFLDPYGAASRVERPVGPGVVATSSTSWDPVHLVPIEETDPRGRRTALAYDERGNLASRTIHVPVLKDPSGKPDTTTLVDKGGSPLSTVVEKWSYDPRWSAETCHIDAEGRLTTTAYQEGLPTQRRAFAKLLAAADMTSDSSCDELAADAEASELDSVVSLLYCGVNTDCGSAGVRGDLYRTVSGGRSTTIIGYDDLGYPRTASTVVSSGRAVISTTVYDSRGRVTAESDSLGHSTARRFDGLDRPIVVERSNTKGDSPGEYRTLSYWPGGQPHGENVGTASAPTSVSSRTWTLNGLNKPEVTTVTGVGIAAVRSEKHYDEAGNLTVEVDGRGVRHETQYDEGDRPTVTSVAIANVDGFQAQGGDSAGFASGSRIVATTEFDAAGNKIAETDVHGHRTAYTLDPLYRVVGLTRTGARNDVAQRTEYSTLARYDLAGNKVWEADGDGNATSWTYDHANRVLTQTDAVGRFTRNTYDALGQLTREETGHSSGGAGETIRLTRSYKGYDGLGRPLGTLEVFATQGRPSGTPSVPGSNGRYETAVEYDDEAHTVATRDRRGYVTVQYLDDLDRTFQTIVDAGTSSLVRQPDARVGGALELASRVEYDAGGNASASVDAEGRRTEVVYDALKRVTQRKLPMGDSESYLYDADGRAIQQTDARGITMWRRYDALGRPTVDRVADRLSTGNAELRVTTRAYVDDLTDPRVLETDAREHTMTRHLDGLHREYRVEKASSTVEAWFDATQTRRQRDPKGYVTETDHDAVGRPIAQRDLDAGGAVRYQQHNTYDDDAGTQTAFDRRAIPTLTVRDGLGRVERVSRGKAGLQESAGDESLVRTEATVYDGGGNAVVVVDPNGHVTERVLDGAGRKVIETQAVGTAVAATSTFKYDRVGNQVEAKGPRETGRPFDVRRSYDDRNRPVRTEDALGNVTTAAFDGAGNKLCEKRPLGGDPVGVSGARGRSGAELQSLACSGEYVTRWTYDEASKLLSVRDAGGGEYSFVYDGARNLIAKQDANGSLTTYGYDELDRRTDEWQHLDAHARLSSRVEVLGLGTEAPATAGSGTGTLHWHYVLDENGNPHTTTDPRGLVTTRDYGVLNRLLTVSYDRPAQVTYPLLRSVVYQYDGNGNVDLVTEEKETVAGTIQEVTDPTYDALERLQREQRYDGKVVEYEYDLKGNRKKVTDPDEVATTYEYDALGRLVTATTPEGVTTYRYWPDGLEQGRSLPNGVEEGRCYDATGRVSQITTARGAVATDCQSFTTVVSGFRYEYDGNGNRKVQVEQRTSPGSLVPGSAEETRYGYDGQDRLSGVRYGDGQAVLYRLDAVGNRTGERELAGQPASLDLGSFSTVDASALVRDVTATFNRADWLLSRADARDATRNATFGWDLAGNLVTKEKAGQSRQLRWDARNTLQAVVENGVVVGTYDYEADGLRVKRRTATEQVEYVLDEQYVLQEARGDLAGHPSYRRYHYAEGPLSVTDASGAQFIGTDALGSTTDLTTTSGAVAAAHQYDAWGQYRNGTAPGATDAKLGYTGHQYDPETGLVYARARYFDPEVGIFISLDAMERGPEDAPNLHRFAWARMNPLRFIDPSGYADEEVVPPPAPPAPQMVTEQDEGTACFSQDGTCPGEQAAQKKAQEAAARKRAEREKFFRDRDAACAHDPSLKMCHAEAVTTAVEDTEGSGSVREDAVPGEEHLGKEEKETLAVGRARKAPARAVKQEMGEIKEYTEAGLQMTGAGSAYVAITGERITGGKASQSERNQAVLATAMGAGGVVVKGLSEAARAKRLAMLLKVRGALRSGQEAKMAEAVVARRYLSRLVRFDEQVMVRAERGVKTLTQIDVELDSAIIEVTTLAHDKKVEQIVRQLGSQANPSGKRVVLFVPGGAREGLRREIEAVGGRVAESWAELDELVRR